MNSPAGFNFPDNRIGTPLLDHAFAAPVIKTRLRPARSLGPALIRPRLTDRLSALTRFRIALLCAPAGFGKTTLMHQWHDQLLSQQAPVGWLSLSTDDNTLTQFMLSLMAALEPLHNEWRTPLQDVLMRDTSPQLQTTTAYLLNELAELQRPVFLLLDDVQALHDPQVLAKLQYLLDHAPDTLRLGIATRSTAGLSLTSLRYRGQILELEADELAFTSAEIQTYFARTADLDLSSEALQQIEDISEGWPTGLQMLAFNAGFQNAPDDVLGRLNDGVRLVSRYFDEMVLSALPTDIHDFLLQISILDELTPELCHAVTERGDADRLLRWLIERNLFITELDDQRPCYRLHHLFAETLHARLLRDRRHDARRLHARASHYLARCNQWREAIRHALQAAPGELVGQDLQGLETGARTLAEQGDLDTLLRWLQQLPREAYANSLRLQVTLAWALAHHFRFEECQQLLQAAGTLADQAGPGGRSIRLEIQAVAAVCAVLADDPVRAEELLLPLVPELGQLPPWIAGLVCNGLSSSYLAQGRHADVLALQRQQPVPDNDDNLLVTLYRAGILGQVYLRQADLHTAGRFFQDALQRAENLAGAHSNGAIALRAHLAELLHERRQWSELTRQVEPHLALIERAATLDGLLKVYRSLIRTHQQQLPGRAEQLVEQGLQLAQQRHWPRFSAGMLSEAIHLKRDQGLLDEALALLGQLEALRDTDRQLAGAGLREVTELVILHKARLAMHQQDYSTASRHLAALARQLLQRGRVLAWLQLETLRLCCEWRLGRHASAMAGLLPLLHRGARQQLCQSFVESSPILIELLQAIQTGPECPDTLRSYIVELLGHFPRHQGSGSGQSNEPLLSEREQEVLAMVATGSANKVIARSLAISAETVKWHLKNIFLKLQVGNRMQALIRAQELGLIPDQQVHQSVMPPSTKNSEPVTKAACSEARKETMAAISVGSPMRPMG